MYQVIETIKNRRSTRKFKPEQLEKEQLEAIIEAGLFAPSAHNEQSWHFTVIQNKELIDDMSEATKKAMLTSKEEWVRNMGAKDEFHIFHNGPTVIVVSGGKASMMPREDAAAATENMLIAAESLDIGSCWIGFIAALFEGSDRDAYIEKLAIPEDYTPYYAVILGYKDMWAKTAPSRKENRVHYIY
jgi:nitroreductase